jgi:predicted O-methyltransferase YrrM
MVIKRAIQGLLFTKGFDFFERLGIHVLPVHYYSPIPDTRALRRKPTLWSRELPLTGIDLNVDEQKSLVERICPIFQKEYEAFPLERSDAPAQYYLNNPSFGFVSGQMHYCMLRYFKPKKVIEVGAGYSTLVSLAALKRNRDEGYECQFITIDPYPPAFIKNDTRSIIKLIAKKVEDTDISYFESLSDQDLLFIDSSHTVKIGGDVNFLILEVLPRLKTGVIIHIHDIQFPYEYSKSYALENHWFWQEQYLVQSFLMYNRCFKILWCASYMHYKYRDLMARFFSPYPQNRVPTSLYIQKKAES